MNLKKRLHYIAKEAKLIAKEGKKGGGRRETVCSWSIDEFVYEIKHQKI